uniref:Uncharacterized protein n=1 Tax=Oncorhynchus mykiss TaxID=8022 RepID=A0A8C7UUP4_ONCMY
MREDYYVDILKQHLKTSASLNEPVICYILDGVLILYSIITTVLFFKVKVSHNTGGILSTSFTWNAFPTVLKEFPHMLSTY